MMEISDVMDQGKELTTNPYNVPYDLQENPANYGNPYDDQIRLLGQINQTLHELVKSAETQRITPRPTQVFLTTIPQSTTVALRTEEIVISVNGATAVTLVVGSSNQFVFNFATAGTNRYRYVTLFGRGVDLSISFSGGAAGSAYLIALPE